MQRILPDTNVLLGIRELDLLMRCHAAEILKVVWCDELFAGSLPQHRTGESRPLHTTGYSAK